jgi:hypothetical protein
MVPDGVENQVRALLAQPNPSAAGTSAARGNSPMLTQNSEHPDVAPVQTLVVPSCVLKATQRTQSPLAADREVFEGVEAYLLVLPHASDATRVDAFVVNASCTASSPGAVLFQATYPR